jgi:hypothetical protein
MTLKLIASLGKELAKFLALLEAAWDAFTPVTT